MPDLLLELGTEELPASFVSPALESLKQTLGKGCKATGLVHGEIEVFGTPRRLALLVHDVAEKAEGSKKVVQGPSAAVAFGSQGEPLTPALKFADTWKLSIADLERRSTPKGDYLFAEIEESGRPAHQVLPGIIADCIRQLTFPKSMRWGDLESSFARPLHWIVALYGPDVIPVAHADVSSGRITKGHRFLSKGGITLMVPGEYEASLENAGVIPSIEKRKARLIHSLNEAATSVGAKLLEAEKLVDEVVQLIEMPDVVVGQFDEKHLDLPTEVLIQEMQTHQRYFPLADDNGKLLPKFLAVSNTPVRDKKLSVEGYERVLRARLTDGRFFFDEDRRIALDEWLLRIRKRTWVGALGSMWEKTERIRDLASTLTTLIGRTELEPVVTRAASLSKFDLESGMVNEFPELQGVMGREYAKHLGEDDDVAVAIFEHYLPRGAGDALPGGDVGAIVGLADRLDSLSGLFGIGKRPTGTKDDFALRRAAITFVRIVIARGYRFSLGDAIKSSIALLQSKLASSRVGDLDTLSVQLLDFFRGRLESLWKECYRVDLVEAVLSRGFEDLVAAKMRLDALSGHVTRSQFAETLSVFKRVANLISKQSEEIETLTVDPSMLLEPAEIALHSEIDQLSHLFQAALESDDFDRALDLCLKLKSPIDRFFSEIMVMVNDRQLRENRLALLNRARLLFHPIADFSKIQAT